ncbi:MAG: hypothetical protein JXR88_14735 [Clostridia bacterium]|nr:hypothetical protein [Clostridia bacterium]
MKKLLLLILMLLLVSCDQDALNYYMEAGVKTDTIDRAKTTLDLKVDMSFNDDFQEEYASIADLLSFIQYKSNSAYDKTTQEKITYQYLGSEGIGVDTTYYQFSDGSYLRVPFVGKYLDFNQIEMIGETDFSAYSKSPLTEEALSFIEEKWMALVNEEDVVNLGNEVIDTPEGEVKVKKFVVTLSNEQLHDFLNDVIEYLKSDQYFNEVFRSYPLYNLEDDELVEFDAFEITGQDWLNNMSELLEDIIVNRFKMTTYIDIDQYIIESKYEVSLNFVGILETIIESLELEANYQMYDLHEKIQFDFPSIAEEQMTTIEEVLEIFEDALPNEE